jgi:hypothetical protein
MHAWLFIGAHEDEHTCSGGSECATTIAAASTGATPQAAAIAARDLHEHGRRRRRSVDATGFVMSPEKSNYHRKINLVGPNLILWSELLGTLGDDLIYSSQFFFGSWKTILLEMILETTFRGSFR